MRQLQCCFHNEKVQRVCLEKLAACRFHMGGYSTPCPYPNREQGQKQIFIEPFLWLRQIVRHILEGEGLGLNLFLDPHCQPSCWLAGRMYTCLDGYLGEWGAKRKEASEHGWWLWERKEGDVVKHLGTHLKSRGKEEWKWIFGHPSLWFFWECITTLFTLISYPSPYFSFFFFFFFLKS